jgi:pyrimidine deaminase RibD-like protein
MGLDQYRLTTEQEFVASFQENQAARKRFRVTAKSGEIIEGIPTTHDDHAPTFLMLLDGGGYYRIPFSELAGAERIADSDDDFMSLAIEQSRCCVPEPGKPGDPPRPRVGAVLVREGIIEGRAFRGEIENGEHAEYTLLEKRLPGRIVANSVLYTTLEPCTKRGEGKVPCVERIIGRRISRVVIGMLDPNQHIRGEGVWRLREHGVHVALCDPKQMAQIEDINREFVRHFRKSA